MNRVLAILWLQAVKVLSLVKRWLTSSDILLRRKHTKEAEFEPLEAIKNAPFTLQHRNVLKILYGNITKIERELWHQIFSETNEHVSALLCQNFSTLSVNQVKSYER